MEWNNYDHFQYVTDTCDWAIKNIAIQINWMIIHSEICEMCTINFPHGLNACNVAIYCGVLFKSISR